MVNYLTADFPDGTSTIGKGIPKHPKYPGDSNPKYGKIYDDDKDLIAYGFERNKLNSYGYRADDFNIRKDINVVTIGCSDAFGYGLPLEKRFSSIFCKTLADNTRKSVNDWNMSSIAKGNDYIARTLLSSINIMKPDIVLICFTNIGRKEYFDIDGQSICFNPQLGKATPSITKWQLGATDTYKRKVWNKLYDLVNPIQDEVNFYINYSLIELVLQNIKWYFSITLNSSTDVMLKHMDKSKYVGYFDKIDNAIDVGNRPHPGPKSHKNLATKFLERIVNK